MAKQKVTVGDMINSKKKSSDKNKDFDLGELDEFLGDKSLGWKPPMNLSVCPALEQAMNIENLVQMGQIGQILGLSDVGKSQFANLCGVACQKAGILPIFIITELKFSFTHLRDMGFELEENVDEETGEITYSGDFIFRDGSTLYSIEKQAEFMLKCLKAQREGKLRRSIFFIVDTVGVLSCEKSLASNTVNAMWDASAYNQWFHKGVCREINLTRKADFPYYAGMVVVNHAWVNNHIGTYGMTPSLEPSGGLGIFKSAQFVLQFGDTTKAGSTLVKATKNGKDVNFAKRTKVMLRKWHGEGCSIKTKMLIVKEGFIADTPQSIKEYTKAHSKEWLLDLGIENAPNDDFEIVDEDMENED